MNHGEITDILSDKARLNHYRAIVVMRMLSEILEEGLKKDGFVKIHKFGIFELVDVKDRKRHSASEGVYIFIKNSKKIKFTPSAYLMERLNPEKEVVKLKKEK